MRMTRQKRQAGYSKTIAEQKHRCTRLNRKLHVRAHSTKIVDQTKQEDDGCGPQYLQSEMRQRKFARAEMPWQPMCQQHDAPECQENSSSTQPRYRTSMNMTIRTRNRDPSASDGKIANPAGKRCRY